MKPLFALLLASLLAQPALTHAAGRPMRRPAVTAVALTSFAATARPAGTVLRWVTTSEFNNAGFEVQRSVDGQHFTTLRRLRGVGSSDETSMYAFLDVRHQPASYRLRQLAPDGSATYSPVVRAGKAPARQAAR